MSDIKGRTGPATRLIPDMKFVCNGTIVGYTVAMSRQRGEQHPKIQIWRRNNSECQSSVYYKTGDATAISGTYCKVTVTPVSSTRDMMYSCQLKEAFRIAVQSGDILGLELPPKNADASVLQFAMVLNGPTNYEFSQLLSSSTAVLSNETKTYQELPQITFEFESGTIIIILLMIKSREISDASFVQEMSAPEDFLIGIWWHLIYWKMMVTLTLQSLSSSRT